MQRAPVDEYSREMSIASIRLAPDIEIHVSKTNGRFHEKACRPSPSQVPSQVQSQGGLASIGEYLHNCLIFQRCINSESFLSCGFTEESVLGQRTFEVIHILNICLVRILIIPHNCQSEWPFSSADMTAMHAVREWRPGYFFVLARAPAR